MQEFYFLLGFGIYQKTKVGFWNMSVAPIVYRLKGVTLKGKFVDDSFFP